MFDELRTHRFWNNFIHSLYEQTSNVLLLWIISLVPVKLGIIFVLQGLERVFASNSSSVDTFEAVADWVFGTYVRLLWAASLLLYVCYVVVLTRRDFLLYFRPFWLACVTEPEFELLHRAVGKSFLAKNPRKELWYIPRHYGQPRG